MVFDIGANIGLYTKIFLKLGANVVAVEPQLECVSLIERCLGSNKQLVILNNALGAVEGKLNIYLTNSSTIASMSPDWIKSVKDSGRFSHYSWDKKETVDVITCNSLINKYGIPIFLKIDVEGYEYEVIKGLTTPIKCISLEIVPEFINSTINCIKYINSLDNYIFNYASSKDFNFLLSENVNAEKIIEILLEIDTKQLLTYDLYCMIDNGLIIKELTDYR